MSRIRIHDVPDRPIPEVLRSLLEFRELPEHARMEFSARLRYIEEITKKISEWVSGAESDLVAFLDRIELDLYINQGAPTGGDSPISSWLVHSSWAYWTSTKAMRAELSHVVTSALNLPMPDLDAAVGAWNVWLAKENEALTGALVAFYEARNLASAMANLFAIDILISALLVGVVKMRMGSDADNRE